MLRAVLDDFHYYLLVGRTKIQIQPSVVKVACQLTPFPVT